MKKFKALAIMLASVLVLVACNTKETTTSQSEKKTDEPTTEASEKETDESKKADETTEASEKETEKPEETTAGGTGGEFVAPELPKGDGSEVIVWNQVFEEWNQEHFTQQAEKYNTLDRGYTVSQEFVTGDTWTERMVAAQSTGTGPDTYIISYNNIYGAVLDEAILPLDEIFAKEQLDDILPNVREMVSFNDKVYAYPQLVEPSTVLFYRTDLFEQAGLDAAPKTWDELIEYGKKLAEVDPNVFALGIPNFGPEMGWSTWGWQMQAAGHLALNDAWDAPTIDEGYLELANLWKTLYDEMIVPEQPLSGYTDLKAYGEGALAMQFTGSWGVAQLINDYPEIYEKTAVAAPPTKDGNTEDVIATNGGWTYVIDANSKNVDGAYNYMSWLLAEDPATPAEFFKVAQYSKAATRQSVSDLISSQGATPDHADIINEIASRAIAEPNYPWDISMAVSGMFEEIALGNVAPEEAQKKVIDSIQEIITVQELPGKNPRQ